MRDGILPTPLAQLESDTEYDSTPPSTSTSTPTSAAQSTPSHSQAHISHDESDHELEESRLWQTSNLIERHKDSWSPDEESKIVSKFDRNLVLFVAFLYMLSFLDRSNIGNARIAGLEADLDLTNSQFSWILTSFYITYIAFEWMSILWKIIPAHIYITAIVLSWGLTASLQSCATSFTSLVCLRVLLGIGEAAFAGIPFYLSFFFKRTELAFRLGLFISSAPLATAFASSLAWLIVRIGESSPIASWRLLFLLEGFPSVIVAVVAFTIIPDSPSKAKYLTRRERRIAQTRLQKTASATSATRLDWRDILGIVVDPKCLIIACMFFSTNLAFASLPAFLPTIIRDMGHSNLISQALAAPPYLFAFAVVVYTAWLSDRLQSRAVFIAFHALLSASGYLLLALSEYFALGNWWRYAAVYPAAVGFFSVVAITITWNINNQDNVSKQGAAFAFMQLVGQCGPLIGTRLYPDIEAPYYTKGMGVCGCAMVLAASLAIGLRMYLSRKNAALARDASSYSTEKFFYIL